MMVLLLGRKEEGWKKEEVKKLLIPAPHLRIVSTQNKSTYIALFKTKSNSHTYLARSLGTVIIILEGYEPCDQLKTGGSSKE